MNDTELGELLKAAKNVPLLNSGINTGIIVSTYPTKCQEPQSLTAQSPSVMESGDNQSLVVLSRLSQNQQT